MVRVARLGGFCFFAMITLQDLLLEGNAFDATVIYAGQQCSRALTARDYPGGCFHFVRSGPAELVAPGRPPVPIEQPSLVFFANAQPHAVRPVEAEGVELVCAVVRYDPAFTRAVQLSFPEVVVIPLYHFSAIAHVLEAFFHEALSRDAGSKVLANRLCLVALTYLMRHVMQGGEPTSGLIAAARDQRIAAAVAAIHERFDQEFSLHTLAAMAGMSRTRFAARFTQLVGKSPHHYLMEYRIGMAKRLLETGMPVKVVASRVGYRTVPAFVRKFKETTGLTPGAWSASRDE